MVFRKKDLKAIFYMELPISVEGKKWIIFWPMHWREEATVKPVYHWPKQTRHAEQSTFWLVVLFFFTKKEKKKKRYAKLYRRCGGHVTSMSPCLASRRLNGPHLGRTDRRAAVFAWAAVCWGRWSINPNPALWRRLQRSHNLSVALHGTTHPRRLPRKWGSQ